MIQAHSPNDILDICRDFFYLDEDVNELRQIAQAMLDDLKQDRLSALLKENKVKKLSKKQEQELDSVLAEVHRLAAKRARYTFIKRIAK